MRKMQKIRILVLLAVFSASLSAVAFAQEAVRWEPTLDNAQRLAAQNHKLVVIHFWAPWCSVCKRMEAEVYSQPAVIAELNADYVPVKVNTDNFPATKQQFGVSQLPTTVIITPSGQVVKSMVGCIDSNQYVALLSQIAADVKRRDAAMYAQVPAGNPPTRPQPSNQPSGMGAPSTPANTPLYGAAPAQGTPAQAAPAQVAPAQGTPAQGTPASMAGNSISSTNNLSDDRYANYYNRAPVANAAPAGTVPANGMQNGTAMSQPNAAAAQGSLGGPSPVMAPANPGYGAQAATAPAAAVPPAQPAMVASRSSAPAGNEAASASVSKNPPLCLDGYCPVALCEKQQWVLGDRRWGAVHRGRTYLFSGPEEQRRFFADADRYAPVMSGNDLVMAVEQNQTALGMREHGVYFGNHIYLFTSEASLDKFSKNPNFYANHAVEALRASNPSHPIQ
jgi:protein disulfide-isomerase